MFGLLGPNQYSIEKLTDSAGQTMDVVKGKGAIAETKTASDLMGVASSPAEAIGELRNMAASRKEGDRISVAMVDGRNT